MAPTNPCIYFQTTVKQFEKQVANVIKERDQTRSDLSKSILSRSRLENLCRELQRQNKEIKVEINFDLVFVS